MPADCLIFVESVIAVTSTFLKFSDDSDDNNKSKQNKNSAINEFMLALM